MSKQLLRAERLQVMSRLNSEGLGLRQAYHHGSLVWAAVHSHDNPVRLTSGLSCKYWWHNLCDCYESLFNSKGLGDRR